MTMGLGSKFRLYGLLTVRVIFTIVIMGIGIISCEATAPAATYVIDATTMRIQPFVDSSLYRTARMYGSGNPVATEFEPEEKP